MPDSDALIRNARRDHAAGKRTAASPSLAQAIRETMADADQAQGLRAHTPAGMHEPTAYIPVAAARSMIATMKALSLPALFGADGRLRRVPGAAPAGTTVRLDAGVVAASRVAGAGAHVMVLPDKRKMHAAGAAGIIALESVKTEFRTIEAAVFGTVDIDVEGDAPVVALPVSGASMDMGQAITKGIRFELPRSERRRIDPEQLTEEISIALTLGLARAADEVLLSAIAATTPDAFSLASAAAQGLAFDELRALVGTTGTGAVVGQDGAVRAAGIPAELTADMAGTIAGAWSRVGIIVGDDVSVHFERLGKAGALAVTAWATMLPLVPDPQKFWTVA